MLLIVLGIQSFGQKEANKKENTLEVSDNSGAEFINGGNKGLVAFFIENFDYPEEAIKNHIEGKIFITFLVDTSGKVSKIIFDGDTLGFGMEEEIIRVLQLTNGMWTPGRENGKNVPTRYYFPYRFYLKK